MSVKLKATYEPLGIQHHASFSIKLGTQRALAACYHYHQEFELILIKSGAGKRYVGDSIDDFEEGELVLLGPNLPHAWRFDAPALCESDDNIIIVNFRRDFLGEDFFNKPELSAIHNLLELCAKGIVYDSNFTTAIAADLQAIAYEDNSFKKLHQFLHILHQLSVTNQYKLVDELSHITISSASDSERINNVFSYIINNYKTNVCLNEAAQLCCMTPNAFCKYFKKITQKTFIEVVVEYRLQYAVTQLLHTRKSITEICYDCGFNDIIHFNRMFKLKMQLSPLQYKKKYQKSVSVV